MKQIKINVISESYTMNGWGEFECNHDHLIVDEPCCDGMGCACNGVRQYMCLNNECSGVTDEEVEQLIMDELRYAI